MASETTLNEFYENENVRKYVDKYCPCQHNIKISYQNGSYNMQRFCAMSHNGYTDLLKKNDELRIKECINCWLMTHVGGYVLDRVRDGFEV